MRHWHHEQICSGQNIASITNLCMQFVMLLLLTDVCNLQAGLISVGWSNCAGHHLAPKPDTQSNSWPASGKRYVFSRASKLQSARWGCSVLRCFGSPFRQPAALSRLQRPLQQSTLCTTAATTLICRLHASTATHKWSLEAALLHGVLHVGFPPASLAVSRSRLGAGCRSPHKSFAFE